MWEKISDKRMSDGSKQIHINTKSLIISVDGYHSHQKGNHHAKQKSRRCNTNL